MTVGIPAASRPSARIFANAVVHLQVHMPRPVSLSIGLVIGLVGPLWVGGRRPWGRLRGSDCMKAFFKSPIAPLNPKELAVWSTTEITAVVTVGE